MNIARILGLSVASGALIAAVPALAQTAPDKPAPAATDSSEGIPDIIITAQRRDESLQKSAIAVSAVAGDTLTKSSISQATDITRRRHVRLERIRRTGRRLHSGRRLPLAARRPGRLVLRPRADRSS
jgi:hypothetical protein